MYRRKEISMSDQHGDWSDRPQSREVPLAEIAPGPQILGIGGTLDLRATEWLLEDVDGSTGEGLALCSFWIRCKFA